MPKANNGDPLRWRAAPVQSTSATASWLQHQFLCIFHVTAAWCRLIILCHLRSYFDNIRPSPISLMTLTSAVNLHWIKHITRYVMPRLKRDSFQCQLGTPSAIVGRLSRGLRTMHCIVLDFTWPCLIYTTGEYRVVREISHGHGNLVVFVNRVKCARNDNFFLSIKYHQKTVLVGLIHTCSYFSGLSKV